MVNEARFGLATPPSVNINKQLKCLQIWPVIKPELSLYVLVSAAGGQRLWWGSVVIETQEVQELHKKARSPDM